MSVVVILIVAETQRVVLDITAQIVNTFTAQHSTVLTQAAATSLLETVSFVHKTSMPFADRVSNEAIITAVESVARTASSSMVVGSPPVPVHTDSFQVQRRCLIECC